MAIDGADDMAIVGSLCAMAIEDEHAGTSCIAIVGSCGAMAIAGAGCACPSIIIACCICAIIASGSIITACIISVSIGTSSGAAVSAMVEIIWATSSGRWGFLPLRRKSLTRAAVRADGAGRSAPSS